jgi:hypothetical protein
VDNDATDGFPRIIFQTPRLWGGWTDDEFNSQWNISDPTPVGWILDLVVEISQTTQYVVSIFVFANLLTQP